MIILSNKYGRLANRLFMYAKFIAFAAHYNVEIHNLAFHDYSHLFEGTHNSLTSKYPQQNFSIFGKQKIRDLIYRSYTNYVQKCIINNKSIKLINTSYDKSYDLEQSDLLTLVKII